MLGKRKSTRMDGKSQLKLRQAASSTPSLFSECPIADKVVNNDEDEDTEEEAIDSGKPRKRARRSQNKSRPEWMVSLIKLIWILYVSINHSVHRTSHRNFYSQAIWSRLEKTLVCFVCARSAASLRYRQKYLWACRWWLYIKHADLGTGKNNRWSGASLIYDKLLVKIPNFLFNVFIHYNEMHITSPVCSPLFLAKRTHCFLLFAVGTP